MKVIDQTVLLMFVQIDASAQLLHVLATFYRTNPRNIQCTDIWNFTLWLITENYRANASMFNHIHVADRFVAII